MNQETYEALKRLLKWSVDRVINTKGKFTLPITKDINQLEDWIDEVAKEYQD